MGNKAAKAQKWVEKSRQRHGGRKLYVKSVKLGMSGVKVLVQLVLPQLPLLEEIYLYDCGVDEAAFVYLADEGLSRMLRLRKLDLSMNTIADRGLAALVEYVLPNTPSIESLFLCRCSIGDNGIQLLAMHGLPTLTNLRELWLSHNYIADDGLCVLAEHGLVHLRKLQALYLNKNDFTEEGLSVFAHVALPLLTKLQKLSVQKNILSGDWDGPAAEAIVLNIAGVPLRDLRSLTGVKLSDHLSILGLPQSEFADKSNRYILCTPRGLEAQDSARSEKMSILTDVEALQPWGDSPLMSQDRRKTVQMKNGQGRWADEASSFNGSFYSLPAGFERLHAKEDSTGGETVYTMNSGRITLSGEMSMGASVMAGENGERQSGASRVSL